jgi:hypothetical protein
MKIKIENIRETMLSKQYLISSNIKYPVN